MSDGVLYIQNNNGERIPVRVNFSWQVNQLRTEIARQLYIDLTGYKLLFRGKVLQESDDYQTLSSKGIQHGSQIFLLIPYRGGPVQYNVDITFTYTNGEPRPITIKVNSLWTVSRLKEELNTRRGEDISLTLCGKQMTQEYDSKTLGEIGLTRDGFKSQP